MAQYYQIYDYKKYDIGYIAVLACGLPPESRVQTALHDQLLNPYLFFLATLVDQQNMLLWQNGGGKSSKPESIIDNIRKQKDRESVPAFRSGADFLAYRERIIKGA